jgi:hypothetical protein
LCSVYGFSGSPPKDVESYGTSYTGPTAAEAAADVDRPSISREDDFFAVGAAAVRYFGASGVGPPSPGPDPTRCDPTAARAAADNLLTADPAEAAAFLARHVADAALAAAACSRIDDLALRSDANKDALGAAGAVRHVAAAMRAYPGDAAVQRQGCCALRRLAEGHPANMAAVGAEGGGRLIAAAMQAHPGSISSKVFVNSL